MKSDGKRRKSVKPKRPANPRTTFVLFAVAFLIVLPFVIGSLAEEHRYESAPSCVAAFALVEPLDGTCRLAPMTIQRIYRDGLRTRSPDRIVLTHPNGASVDVLVGSDPFGSVARGLRLEDDRDATVQYFRARIVLVRTRSGILKTGNLPEWHLQTSLWLFVIFGTIALVFARRARAVPTLVRIERSHRKEPPTATHTHA